MMSVTIVKRGVRPIHTLRQKARALRSPGSRSTLRTVKGMDEIKGMRSVSRKGRDDWEPRAEARRALLAYNRRMRRLNPTRGESVE
jgi:hypothetical protein